MNFMKQLSKKYSRLLWLYVITLAVILLIMASAPLGVDAYDEAGNSAVWAVLMILALFSAIATRYMLERSAKDVTSRKPWAIILSFPVAATLVMLPWLLGGILVDTETSVVMSILLWVLLAYVALLLGLLLIPFVVLPLELIGVGIISLLQGKYKNAKILLGIGLYIAAVTVFTIIGGLSISNVIVGQLGWIQVLFALFGLPAGYEIESLGLLWTARVIGLLLLAVPIALFLQKGKKRPVDAKKKR